MIYALLWREVSFMTVRVAVLICLVGAFFVAVVVVAMVQL